MEAEGTANENMCPALGGVATVATASAEGAGGGGTTVSSSAWSPPMFIFRLAFIWATMAWWRCSGVIAVVFVFSGRGGSFGAAEAAAAAKRKGEIVIRNNPNRQVVNKSNQSQ